MARFVGRWTGQRSDWSTRIVLVAALAVLFSLTPTSVDPAAAQVAGDPLVVDSVGDEPDDSPADGTCLTAVGTCTLRAAIEQANHDPGPAQIHFDIATEPGPARIAPAEPLPPITGGQTTIDGYTQPRSEPNTAEQGSNAVIGVEIDGTNDGTPLAYGLKLTSAANTVRGLAVFGIRQAIVLEGEEADGNVIVGNWIGTDAAAEFVSPDRRTGVNLSLGPDRNVIGRPTLADRNVIAGYSGHGIIINHGETSENVIQNNLIGLSPSFDRAMSGYVGIDIQWWSWGNLVGGFGQMEGNVVSGGHKSSGIDLSHAATGNSVIGNCVGTLPDCDTISAYSGNLKYGLAIKDGPKDNYFGFNVVGGNRHGIYHTTRYNGAHVFDQNRIGVGVDGGVIPNQTGIWQAGFDQYYYRNIIANSTGWSVGITNNLTGDIYFRTDDRTYRAEFRQNSFYNNGDADFLPLLNLRGATNYDVNDDGDVDDGPNGLLNTPEITGLGRYRVFGTACANCVVEAYIPGVVEADGSLNPYATTGTRVGAADIGYVVADADGSFSLRSGQILPGRELMLVAIDPDGNTSELSEPTVVPATHTGVDGTATTRIVDLAAPDRPSPPPPYEPPASTSISGTVSQGNGDPLVGAGVQLFAAADGGGRGTWQSSTSSDSAGRFTLYPPSAGCWILTYIAPQGEAWSANQSRWLNRQHCVEAGQALTGADAQLLDSSRLSTISGSVVEGVDGVADVTVDLFTSTEAGGRDRWVGFTTTASDGGFGFEVAEGCWSLTYVAPTGRVFVSGSRYATRHLCVTAGETSTVTDVSLLSESAGTIEGRVTRDGGPVSGVTSNLFEANADGSRGRYLTEVVSGDDGSYRYQRPPGCYIEVLIAPDGATFTDSGGMYLERPICLADGETVATLPEALLNP